MIMAIMSVLVTLPLLVAVYAGFVKLAAYLYQRTMLSWRSAFVFGALVAPLAFAAAVTSQLLRDTVPIAVVIIGGLALVIAVGAWFLGPRAKNVAGEAVGFNGAAVVSAIAVGIAFVLGLAFTFVLRAVVPA
jgi:hypothetical protein